MARFSPGVRFDAPGPLDFSGLSRSLQNLADTRFRRQQVKNRADREAKLDAERAEERAYQRDRDAAADTRMLNQERNAVRASGGTPLQVEPVRLRELLPTNAADQRPLMPRATPQHSRDSYVQMVGDDPFVVDPMVTARREGAARLAEAQPVNAARRGELVQDAGGALTGYGVALPEGWESLPLGQLEAMLEQEKAKREQADARDLIRQRAAAERSLIDARRVPEPPDFEALADEAIEATQGDARKAADLLTRDPNTRDVFTQGMSGRHLQAAAERYRQKTSPKPGTIRQPSGELDANALIGEVLAEPGMGGAGQPVAPVAAPTGRPSLSPEERTEAQRDPAFQAFLREKGYTDADWQL